MFWNIVTILFILYVIYSLSTIKYQLKLISKHLNVKEKESEKISNEEIEKQLEDDLKH
jgi:predicted membrane protein